MTHSNRHEAREVHIAPPVRDGQPAEIPPSAEAGDGFDGGQTEPRLSHLDQTGAARMVDVSQKDDSTRVAEATGAIRMTAETLALISANALQKGDVLAVARIAGTMAAKRTSDLIPLCHPLPLTGIEIVLTLDSELPGVRALARVRCVGRTGVEMEALTAVTVCLLTIYDMAKAVDRAMEIGYISVLSKIGGKSGPWQRA